MEVSHISLNYNSVCTYLNLHVHVCITEIFKTVTLSITNLMLQISFSIWLHISALMKRCANCMILSEVLDICNDF